MAQYRLERLAPVASDLEQLGTKEKFWFSMDTEPKLWLFKFSRAGTGEHWSEKCAAELCHLLGIPHAEYELALIDGRYGVISPNMILPDTAWLWETRFFTLPQWVIPSHYRLVKVP